MNNFRIIYRILKYLEAALDVPCPDMTPIKAEALGLTQSRWQALLVMLAKEGYIEGLVYGKRGITEKMYISVDRTRITLRGLEYLVENRLMNDVESATGAPWFFHTHFCGREGREWNF